MRTIIVYASMSGTTELMAYTIAKELERDGEQVEVKDAFDTFAEELNAYDRIIIGSHTWGFGELSDEILDFYDELLDLDLTGKAAAVFGPGDSSYELFAEAVNILEETLIEQGCDMITKGLKVDSWTETDHEIEMNCMAFATDIANLTAINGAH